MRKASASLSHGPMMTMGGQQQLGAAERLRVYRRCFHELDEQLMQLQASGGIQDLDLRKMQAELRALEDLIVIFTDLNSALKAKQVVSADAWLAEAAMEGPDLSLLTDLLFLSASSPWTVYVVECIYWLLCYVSPSCKSTTGWMPQELIGTAAWDVCHPDDIPTLKRMLFSREIGPLSNGSVIYRRMRKDSSYTTVQATGRALGTRNTLLPLWYAWVEQDNRNFSSVQDQEENLHINTNKVKFVAPKSAELEIPLLLRSKSQSAMRPTSPEVLYANLQQPLPPDNIIANPPIPSHKSTETESGLRDAGILAKSAAEEDENLQLASSRVKALIVPPVTRGQSMKALGSSSSANLSSDREFLKHKKVLLVEDDPVIRKIVHCMLLNMNCEVTVTSNGREALDILQRTPVVEHNIDDKHELPAQFNLVLMDLHMPVMDGTHAVQIFRSWEADQNPPRKRIVIFAVTANSSDADMVKCAQSGFDEFVTKPLTVEKLMDRLKMISSPSYDRKLDFMNTQCL
ncbi:unnamed protein product [Sphagnum compactum]